MWNPLSWHIVELGEAGKSRIGNLSLSTLATPYPCEEDRGGKLYERRLILTSLKNSHTSHYSTNQMISENVILICVVTSDQWPPR